MRILLFSLTTIILFSHSYGQKIFYDSLWEETSLEKALYYRVIDTISEDSFAVQDYFINDSIQMVGSYSSISQDVKEGLFTWYYENGRIKSKMFYQGGIANGLYKSFYESGLKRTEGQYLNGEKDSTWSYWYTNGRLKINCTYKEGKWDGLHTKYNEDGTKDEVLYKNGEFAGYAMRSDTSSNELIAKLILDEKLKTGSLRFQMDKEDGGYFRGDIVVDGKKYSGIITNYDAGKNITSEGTVVDNYFVNFRIHEHDKKIIRDVALEKSKKNKVKFPFSNFLEGK